VNAVKVDHSEIAMQLSHPLPSSRRSTTGGSDLRLAYFRFDRQSMLIVVQLFLMLWPPDVPPQWLRPLFRMVQQLMLI
jgi:hypothetical protein